MTDIDETQAAEPILDATEPAPAEDATQSIYAWSEHDGDETLVIQRRSWKLPVALASVATAAAMTTGVVMAWPAPKTPPPAQSPTIAAPAVPPQSNPRPLERDSRGIPILPKNPTPEEQQAVVTAIFDLRGIPYRDPVLAAADAGSVCTWLGNGHYTEQQLADHVAATHPGLDQVRAADFTAAAVGTYCRQYDYLLADVGSGATS